MYHSYNYNFYKQARRRRKDILKSKCRTYTKHKSYNSSVKENNDASIRGSLLTNNIPMNQVSVGYDSSNCYEVPVHQSSDLAGLSYFRPPMVNTTLVQPPTISRIPKPGSIAPINVSKPPNLTQENNVPLQSPTRHPPYVPVKLIPINREKEMPKPGIVKGAKSKKRVYTNDEDTKLVDKMMELHVLRKYARVYDELKLGYAKAAQILYKENLSNIMKLQTDFNIVHDMLVGVDTSGFSWDSEKLFVTADNEIWDEYIKTHPDAAQFRKRPFPHYDKLCILFDKERDTGFQVDGIGDEGVIGENQMSPCEDAKDLQVGKEDPSYQVSKRKRDETKDLSETCVKASRKLSNPAKSSGLAFSDNAAHDIMVKVTSQVKDLHGLTLDERLITISVIGRDATLSQMFDQLDGNEKIRMAQLVANGSIS